MRKTKSINQQIIDHLDKGYVLCDAIADKLTKSQSAGRIRRKLIENNPSVYGYFWVAPKDPNRNIYKAYYKISKAKIQIEKTLSTKDIPTYRLLGATGYAGAKLRGLACKTKAEAINQRQEK